MNVPKKSFIFVPVIFHFKNKPEIRDENVHLAQIVLLTEILENVKEMYTRTTCGSELKYFFNMNDSVTILIKNLYQRFNLCFRQAK